VTFSIPATVFMESMPLSDARMCVADYVHGRQKPPTDFSVSCDGDDVDKFFGQLEIGDYGQVQDIELENRLQLTFDPEGE
jgi:hypothetical protein